jgi:hypothetical protein
MNPQTSILSKKIFIVKSYIYAGTGSNVTSKTTVPILKPESIWQQEAIWRPSYKFRFQGGGREVFASATGGKVTRGGSRRAYLLLAHRPATKLQRSASGLRSAAAGSLNCDAEWTRSVAAQRAAPPRCRKARRPTCLARCNALLVWPPTCTPQIELDTPRKRPACR